MRRLARACVLGLVSLVLSGQAYAEPARVLTCTAQSVDYENNRICSALVRPVPHLEALVVCFMQKEPGLPQSFIIRPYTQWDLDMVGKDEEGRSWIFRPLYPAAVPDALRDKTGEEILNP